VLLDMFGGNVKLAVAGYNAGEGAVQKYNGIPPYPETQDYVRKVLGFYGSKETLPVLAKSELPKPIKQSVFKGNVEAQQALAEFYDDKNWSE